jgi:hypothetical protein
MRFRFQTQSNSLVAGFYGVGGGRASRMSTVHNKDEVLAFLQKRPDRQFFLICGGEPTKETTVNEQEAVFCGLLVWDSKAKVLKNKRLTFES